MIFFVRVDHKGMNTKLVTVKSCVQDWADVPKLWRTDVSGVRKLAGTMLHYYVEAGSRREAREKVAQYLASEVRHIEPLNRARTV